MNFHINRAPAPVDEWKRSASSRAAAEKRGDGFRGDPGRNLDQFRPERWLVKDEQTGEETFNAYAIPSLAFGGGYRGCFGECKPSRVNQANNPSSVSSFLLVISPSPATRH